MGFFDRFASGKPQPGKPADSGAEKPAIAGGVIPRLAEARVKLGAKDLPAAMAIYEEVLASAGARPDVLVTISGDLGVHGNVRELIELIAPRYDAAKHGPATGLNLLQAYLVVRNADAAQHLLDILFSLQRPELEERLFGFSNALADMMAIDEQAAAAAGPEMTPEETKISLASISKPIWFYGLEEMAAHLLPRQEGRLRRVAFAQYALLGLQNAMELAGRPEDALGRLSRGLPLWFAETFSAAAGYETFAAIGTTNRKAYALFPTEWMAENVRQLNESNEQPFDFVVTGALSNRNDDFGLTLKIWEVKKFRELKAFSIRWTPATADESLRQFHELLRTYMEWAAFPEGNGLPYAAPAAPYAHAHALGATLTQFLGEKGVLEPTQVASSPAPQLDAAVANPDDVRAQLNLVSTMIRLKATGAEPDAKALRRAQEWLATDAANRADLSSLLVKLA
jgi:hypothetical protein